MNFEYEPEAVTSAASQVSNVSFGPIVTIALIVAFGFIGRLVFIAYGDRIQNFNPLKALSGVGLVIVAVGILTATVFVSGKQVKAMVLLKSILVEPVLVTLLKKDSCTITDESYCVIVFEDDREISVNWYNRRVDMFKLVNDFTLNPLWASPRPKLRSTADHTNPTSL